MRPGSVVLIRMPGTGGAPPKLRPALVLLLSLGPRFPKGARAVLGGSWVVLATLTLPTFVCALVRMKKAKALLPSSTALGEAALGFLLIWGCWTKSIS